MGRRRPPLDRRPSRAWRLWALVPILLLVGVVAVFASTGASLLDLVGRAPPPLDEFDIRRVEFKPGRDQDPGDESAAVKSSTIGDRDRRRRDRAVPARRPGESRPAALEHDRRPLPMGRGRSVHGRRHELERDRDELRRAGRGRDARRIAARIPRLRADRLPGRHRPGRARARLAALAATTPTRAGSPRSWRSRPGCSPSSPSTRSRGAASSRRHCRVASRGTGLILLGVAASYLGLTFVSQRSSAARRREPSAPLEGAALAEARRRRDRAPQPRRRTRDRLVDRARRARARDVPDRRVHGAQHHRGARHRGTDRRRRPGGLAAARERWRSSPARPRSSAPGSAASSRATCSASSSSPSPSAPRFRSWSRSAATSRAARRAGSASGHVVGGYLAGIVVMYATGLLVG